MPPRRGDGIGQGRPVANVGLLEEIRNLRTRMESMETDQGENLMKEMPML